MTTSCHLWSTIKSTKQTDSFGSVYSLMAIGTKRNVFIAFGKSILLSTDHRVPSPCISAHMSCTSWIFASCLRFPIFNRDKPSLTAYFPLHSSSFMIGTQATLYPSTPNQNLDLCPWDVFASTDMADRIVKQMRFPFLVVFYNPADHI